MPYGAELFCRETLAAIVDSSDAETVELVFLQCDTGTCGLHVYTVVIAARAHCHVDIVGCRRSGTLRLVTLGKPRQGGVAVLALLYLEVHRGERTDYRLLTMCRGLEAQYALVYGACYGELKVGVVSHAHVGETLMGECLEDSGRHQRHACLGVVAVVEVAPCPLAVARLDVALALVEEHLGELFGAVAGETGIHLAVVVVCGTDGKRTVYALHIVRITSIGMHRQCQVYWHVLAFGF